MWEESVDGFAEMRLNEAGGIPVVTLGRRTASHEVTVFMAMISESATRGRKRGYKVYRIYMAKLIPSVACSSLKELDTFLICFFLLEHGPVFLHAT